MEVFDYFGEDGETAGAILMVWEADTLNTLYRILSIPKFSREAKRSSWATASSTYTLYGYEKNRF